jgi:hypothetical protein
VGRPGSPVLERYPSKASSRPAPVAPATAATVREGPVAGTVDAGPAADPGGPAKPLIALERPFSVDDFAQQLGETTLRVTVPREELPAVLQRICDFMGFGIYVYSIKVRPAPAELLKQFVVELERVDFSPAERDWVPFQEQGRADNPFGPGGRR